MGMGSVDVAVLWPKNYGQFDVCYKPTSRLSQFASLGIPVVAYPFASYIDMFVRSLSTRCPDPTRRHHATISRDMKPRSRCLPRLFRSAVPRCVVTTLCLQLLVDQAMKPAVSHGCSTSQCNPISA